jgi:putative flippase GtrA
LTMNYIKDFCSEGFIKFLLVGGFAALVNFISRILLSRIVSYILAIVIAYLIGMVVAFVLTKLFVFDVTAGKTQKQFLYFTIVNLFAVFQTVLVSVSVADYLLPLAGIYDYRQELAHMVGICFPVFTSFLGHKYFTFR